MAGLFDFEHYYKEMNIKTDIKLDVSDIPMKSSATSSVMNEDGTIDEVNMNELVTNNVMYKIAVIYVNGAKIPTGSRIVLTTNSIEDDSAVTTVNGFRGRQDWRAETQQGQRRVRKRSRDSYGKLSKYLRSC